jgi:GNAT superfamily N-acetyltransferase
MSVLVRPALPDDVEQMHRFVRELAEFERAPEQVTGTAEMLAEALFGARPVAEALIATVDGETVGMAVFYRSFSTWRCLPGVWLEDLYVAPAHRRSGAGRALVAALARLTIERGGARLEWNALDWNEPALTFYERIGASRLSAWELHQLADDALVALATGAHT